MLIVAQNLAFSKDKAWGLLSVSREDLGTVDDYLKLQLQLRLDKTLLSRIRKPGGKFVQPDLLGMAVVSFLHLISSDLFLLSLYFHR